MRGAVPAIALLLLSFALGWAVLFKGGVWPDEWCVSLVVIGAASCFHWLFAKFPRGRPLNFWLCWLLVAVPAYIAFTLIPLPSHLLDILSPARAALLHQLQPVSPSTQYAPVSVNPPATLLFLFTTIAYITAFLLVREIAISLRRWPWATAIPLLVIATFEAALGIVQSFAGTSSGVATGTYTNRDHFAGLLEMVLPFAVLYGLSAFREKSRGVTQTKPLVLVCACWSIAGLLFAAILYSLSRMGLIVALVVLFLIALLSFTRDLRSRSSKWLMTASVSMAIALFSVLLLPDQLAGRFVALAAKPAASTEIRSVLWRETLPVISEFKVFGCGLGGFESVFLRHQAIVNDQRVEFAHNDYLQYSAELGVIGFLLFAAPLALIARQMFRGLALDPQTTRGLLSIACATAWAGMALHSVVDFNTYIPANALILAWIGGIASATTPD